MHCSSRVVSPVIFGLAISALVTGLVGCDPEDAGPTGTDTTPPTVASTNPADAAEGVSVGTTITITFDEAMDPTTIPGAVVVSNDLEDPYGTVTYDAATHSARFTAASPLIAYSTYYVHVTTGARDLAGNALAAAYDFSFLTAGSGTAVHPIGVYPSNGSTNASIDESPYIEFDGELDQSTLDGNFTLRRTSDGAVVPGTVIYDLGEIVTVRFDPTDRLTCPTSYTAEMTTDVRSASGVPLEAPVTFTFTTGCPRFGILLDNHPGESAFNVFGRVTDDQGELDCGLTGLYCYGTYTVGTTVTLTATPSSSGVFYGWVGPAAFCTGTNNSITVSLGEQESANCKASFGPSPGVNVSLNVTYGSWIDRVYDATSGSPRIDCGPSPNPSVCNTTVAAGDAVSLVLAATKNVNAPAGTLTWTCTHTNFDEPPTQTLSTYTGTAIGPMYLSRNTDCHVELTLP